jgi:hypothetical protein
MTPVEDHDDLLLRRIRQRPVGAEPARPPVDLLLCDVLEPARAERRQQVVADHRACVAHGGRLAPAIVGQVAEALVGSLGKAAAGSHHAGQDAALGLVEDVAQPGLCAVRFVK